MTDDVSTAAASRVRNPYLQVSYPRSVVLRSVILVARHGARVPLNTFPNDDSTWKCDHGIFTSIRHSATEALERTDHVFRLQYEDGLQHFNGNCARGQLTPAGLSQHAVLGSWLRENYIHRVGLLDGSRDDIDTSIYVRSTDTTRTKESAKAFLTGLFPDLSTSQRYPFLIHTREERVENMYPRGSCPKFAYWHKQVKRAIADQRAEVRKDLGRSVLDVLHSHTSDTSRRVAHTRLPHDRLPSWEGLNNSIACRNLSGVDLPSKLTLSIVDSIEREAALDSMSKSASLWQRRLGIGRFLADLLPAIEGVARGPDNTHPRISLFFGHDNTLTPLLMAFDVPTFRVPPMASALVLETFTAHRDPDRRYVRLLWNGQPRVIESCALISERLGIQGPGVDGVGPEFCPLKSVVSLIESQIPEDWGQECSLPSEGLEEEDLQHLVPPAQTATWLITQQAAHRSDASRRGTIPPGNQNN